MVFISFTVPCDNTLTESLLNGSSVKLYMVAYISAIEVVVKLSSGWNYYCVTIIMCSNDPNIGTSLSPDLITCFCDSTYQLSPNCFEDRTVSCNGRCFQRMFLVEGAIHMDWNCMADLEDEQMLDPCDAGGRLPEQAVVKCCDEKDLCNSDLLTTEPPTTGSPECKTLC